MNFLEFQDEVIALRFNASERTRIKRWLNLRYQWIWSQADWTFKSVTGASLTVTNGDATPSAPAELAAVTRLYDERGDALLRLEQSEWERYAYQQPPPSGRPEIFTVIDRQIYLSPTPSANATYKLSYRRRLSHVDSIAGIVGGIMVEDLDQPFWPAEHDYLLVVDATILGQQAKSDPTWRDLVDQRNELLAGMKADLTRDVTDQVEVWGETWS